MGFTVHEKEHNIVVIDCPERLDLTQSGELKKILAKEIDKNNCRFIINLTSTRYVDSSGLGAIVSHIAKSRSNGGDIRLALTSRLILNLLEITNLNKILKTYDDVDTAITSY
jgi:anti-sigma B factor antagonist